MSLTDRTIDDLNASITCPFCARRQETVSTAPSARDVQESDLDYHEPGCPWLITNGFANMALLYEWLPLVVLAERMQVSPERLYNAIRHGRIKGVQLGRSWWLTLGNAAMLYHIQRGG